LYDDAGSHLFERICATPEYYLTRAEAAIFRDSATEILAPFHPPLTIVELGSGSAEKTRVLLDAWFLKHESLTYAPIDISKSALESSAEALLADYAGLKVVGFACEYEEGLQSADREIEGPRLVLWLGSNAGNLPREEAIRFLKAVRKTLHTDDRLLVGIDLHKDTQVIEAAYNDAGGVTAMFSKNLLTRINRELEGDFDLEQFQHVASYEVDNGWVETHLVSHREQTVRIGALDLEIQFTEGETIHTEYSCKYRPEQIEAIAHDAGFRVENQWFDPNGYFSESLFAPA
jgi:L-histidine N-alpha-methyltransferase